MIIDTNDMSNASEESSSYLTLAEVALQHYALGPVRIAFVQHNAGIVFHVTTQETGHQYLLKIYKRIGAGDDPLIEQLEPGLHWLAAFAQASDVVVQVPVRTTGGQFVGQVSLTPLTPPINCTLQHWVEGNVPNGDFTVHHARQLGRVMAKIHDFSRTYPPMIDLPTMRRDTQALAHNTRLLCTTLNTILLSPQDIEIITAAETRIAAYMVQLGNGSDVWGPIHGDLHYDNVLFYADEVRPIDFTGLLLGHYLYDIGVTLYHTFHQGTVIREAFFTGYEQVKAIPSEYQRYIEGFIAYAAIDNLAWNSTIPEQVETQLFQRNLENLVNAYCTPVAQGEPFLFS